MILLKNKSREGIQKISRQKNLYKFRFTEPIN
jgi:hypothetical protein